MTCGETKASVETRMLWRLEVTAKKKQMPLHLVVHFHARLCSYMSRISLLLVHILIGMNASMHKKNSKGLWRRMNIHRMRGCYRYKKGCHLQARHPLWSGGAAKGFGGPRRGNSSMKSFVLGNLHNYWVNEILNSSLALVGQSWSWFQVKDSSPSLFIHSC